MSVMRGSSLLSYRLSWQSKYPSQAMQAILWCIIALMTISFAHAQGYSFHRSRSKRTLVYIPPGGVVQMVMGVGLPLVLNYESVIVGMVLKAGYNLPHNSTDYTSPSVTYAKKKRSISRWDLYESMAQAAELHGFGGKECILRTICEVADVPIDKTKGLFEELVHVIFTPSTTQESIKRYSDSMYRAAEQLGRELNGYCDVLFPECRVSFAEMFTRLRSH